MIARISHLPYLKHHGGIHETATYHLHEIIQDYRHDVVGSEYIIRLDPNEEPAAIFRVTS